MYLKNKNYQEITIEDFNVSNIDNNLKDETVHIPFRTVKVTDKLFDVYTCIIGRNPSINDSPNIDLIVDPKSGHNLFNYDGEYNYSLGSYIHGGIRPDVWGYKCITVGLNDAEKKIIQSIVWKSRNVRLAVQMQVAAAIKDIIKNDNMVLFIDNYVNNEYFGVWKSTTKDKGIAAKVSNVNNGSSRIELFPMGQSVQIA